MVGRGEPVATHCMSVVVPGRRVTFVGETWKGVRKNEGEGWGVEKGGGWKGGGRVGRGKGGGK